MSDDVDLILLSRGSPFDLDSEKVDAAVYFGGLDWPDAQMTPLCPESLAVIVSPSLLRDRRLPSPADVLKMPLLHFTERPHLWSDYARDTGHKLHGKQGSYFDQFSLLISGVVAGLGAAILPSYLIEKELHDTTLIAVGQATGYSDKSYFVATPAGGTRELTSHFIEWARFQFLR